MTTEEYQKTRQFMEKKALALMDHEGKPIITAGLPIENYTKYNIHGRVFYSMESNLFKEIIRNKYYRIHKEFPTKFGTGNASDIIELLYDCKNVFTFEEFVDVLRNEQFAYVFESNSGEIQDRVLRIDLFRHLDKKQIDQTEFTGGIFHAYKHFSIDGRNLSTGKDLVNILHPKELIAFIIEAFFIETLIKIDETTFESTIPLNEKYQLQGIFYFEKKTNVYFLKTIRKDPIKQS